MWRRATAKRFLPILRHPEARILDLCCGTGDLAFALDRLALHSTLRAGTMHGTAGSMYGLPIVGSDFVEPMLTRARGKAIASRCTTVFATADALNLPYANSTFNLVTTAFGFRNLANYGDGLQRNRSNTETGRGSGNSGIFRAAHRDRWHDCFVSIFGKFSRASAKPSRAMATRMRICPVPSRNFRRQRNFRR